MLLQLEERRQSDASHKDATRKSRRAVTRDNPVWQAIRYVLALQDNRNAGHISSASNTTCSCNIYSSHANSIDSCILLSTSAAQRSVARNSSWSCATAFLQTVELLGHSVPSYICLPVTDTLLTHACNKHTSS